MAKQNSEIKGIQKKLVAAVAMLLVACIMVVSSSYAWFTLSTTPEVKGIKTSIGGNGNLEMALREIADVANITNTTSGGTFPQANTFWGNLVDLTDTSYGMDKVALAPARLNLVGGKINVAASYLLTAVYGTDGRVSGLEANTFAGKYNATAGGFAAAQDYGVRGIGTKSGMSAAELALRDARTAVSTAKGSVEFDAKASLQEDSIKLANILIYHELDANKTFTEADRTNIVNAIARLQGVVDKLKAAMKATVLPVVVVVSNDPDVVFGSEHSTTKPTINVDNITITASDITVAGFEPYEKDGDTYTAIDIWEYTGTTGLRDQLKAAAADLDEMQQKLTAATTAVPTAGGAPYDFDDISAPLGHILSTADIEIEAEGGNKDFGDYDGNKIDMGLDVVGGKPIVLRSGIYYSIGEFIGKYQAGATLVLQGNFGTGLNFPEPRNIPVTMKVNPTAPASGAFYLNYFLNQLSGLKTEGGDDTGAITDVYGMAIDLAFRTNAANSNLMLQTAPEKRVADENATQGDGSYMQFNVTGTGYTATQLRDLMSAVRVVFFDYSSGDIYSVAGLDTTGVPGTLTEAVKANLVMYNYDTTGDMLTLDAAKADTDAVVTALTQNAAKGVSVLVYLDGDMVENSDVSINAQSATVTMNLQFASSADLTPMDYTFTDPATP